MRMHILTVQPVTRSEFLESLEDQTFFNGVPGPSEFSSNLNLNQTLSDQGPSNQGSQFMSPLLSPEESFSQSSSFPLSSSNQQPNMMLNPSNQSHSKNPSLPPPPPQSVQFPPMQSEEDFQQESSRPLSPTISQQPHLPHIDVLPPSTTTKTEQFLLTAADQEDGTRDERLARVIHAKFEAGLLKPFNYVKGYARLSRWMDRRYAQ